MLDIESSHNMTHMRRIKRAPKDSESLSHGASVFALRTLCDKDSMPQSWAVMTVKGRKNTLIYPLILTPLVVL